MDTITERLALLILDNPHRTLTEDADLRLGYGLCGALALDLLLAGALTEHEAAALHPQPAVQLDATYLREAFGAIPSYTELELTTVLKSFYAIMPRLKTLVLDALVEQGVLRADTSELKWAFALKSYVLEAQEAGYRQRVLDDVMRNDVRLMDYWVVQLAAASRLLWTEQVGEKAELREALAHIQHLQMIGGQFAPLLELVADVLPHTIATSHKLPKLRKKRKYPTTWEWRGFWVDEGATLIQSSELYKESLEDVRFSEISDDYLVVEGVAANIKWRNRSLEVKVPQESLNGYTAYSPKVIYDFPLSPKKFAKLFAAVTPPQKPLKSLKALSVYLHDCGVANQRLKVKKKRFQVKLLSQVKVEFCTLKTAGRSYLSVCVEGPDYDITTAHSHNFQSGGVMAMNYVEFLKHCLMEHAA